MSNFDLAGMHKLRDLPAAPHVASNQVLYKLIRRDIEWDLLPCCQQQKIPIMAYSPVEQARLLAHPALGKLAAEQGLSAAQLALAWVLQHKQLMAIPKTAQRRHLRENFAATQITLDSECLRALDRLFPPPKRAKPLEML